MNVRILTMGDSAFTVEFPDLKGRAGARFVAQVCSTIASARVSGVRDIIAASRSLTVCVDPLNSDLLQVKDIILSLLPDHFDEGAEQARTWSLPVCYDAAYAPDLEEVADWAGMRPSEVVSLHMAQTFDVLFIGFLPGFPFMSGVPDILQFPRRKTPRVAVPAGSVAIANDQAAIYPWESPGGWHLLGRCPIPLFDPDWRMPSLLASGDQISFYSISAADFEQMQDDFNAKRLDPSAFLQAGAR